MEFELIVTLEFKPRNKHIDDAGPVNFVRQLTEAYAKPLCWDIPITRKIGDSFRHSHFENKED